MSKFSEIIKALYGAGENTKPKRKTGTGTKPKRKPVKPVRPPKKDQGGAAPGGQGPGVSAPAGDADKPVNVFQGGTAPKDAPTGDGKSTPVPMPGGGAAGVGVAGGTGASSQNLGAGGASLDKSADTGGPAGITKKTAEQEVQEKIEEDIEILKYNTGKMYKPYQITIFNAEQYNTSFLRNSKDKKKYLEDPIAFLANHVWTYSLDNPQHLVFNYKMPKNILNNINPRTIGFIQETIAFIKKSGALTGLTGELKIQVANALFKQRFVANIINYLKVNGYASKNLDPYYQQIPFGSPIGTEYEKLFYFWINQIFAFNVEITEDQNLIVFKTNKQSYKPLFFATYFLLDNTQGGNKSTSFLDNYPNVKYNVDGLGLTEFFLGSLATLAEKEDYVNTNNYWYTSKTKASALNINILSNYKSSLYTSSKVSTIEKNYLNKLKMVKEIKKCSKVKDNKKETSLRLFYKEGNDDVLIDKIPKGGLGCQTELLEWKKAQKAFYNIESLQKGRLNNQIPYYSILQASIKKLIPDNLDILKTIPKAELPDLKTFNTLVTLDYLKQIVTYADSLDLLIDKSLTPYVIDSIDTHAEYNFWAFRGKSGNNGDWGPNDFLKNLVESTNAARFVNLSPYLGMYNVGYVLEKYDSADNLLQEFYINPVETKGAVQKGYHDVFTYLDSQIKYGKKYSYRLKQLVAAPSLSYNYRAKAGSKDSGIKLQKTFDGGYSFALPNNPYKFKNQILRPDLTDSAVESTTSYIDLPPKPTYMDVYPKRGINDRIVIVFNEFASSLAPEIKTIPKKEWSDGWQAAKDLYVDQAPQNPPLKDEDMPFMSGDVDKILLYKLEGEKPTHEDDFTEIFDELNVLFDGYSKEVILKPNTKYYFATRSLSYTGLYSYLSEVYSVELVDDGGAVFPLVEIVQLEKDAATRKEKMHFSSQFRIEPALLQQAPNTAKNLIGYLQPIVFSSNDETRPRFKIRLTSKKTGRKADFNVIYKRIIHEKSDDAGSLTLSQTKKEKLLISYKGKANDTLGKALSEDKAVLAQEKSEEAAKKGMEELAKAMKRAEDCKKLGLAYDDALYKLKPATGGCKDLTQ